EAQLGAELTDVIADSAGSTVVAVGRTGVVTAWTPSSGATRQIASLGETVWGTALVGNVLVVSRADGTVTAWDLAATGGAPLWERAGATGGALDVAASSGLVAVASGDGALRFWDATGTAIASPLAAGGSGLRQVVAAPNGALWTVDRDGKVFRSDVLVAD
ncbi:MAG: hypothetical protein ACT4QG_01745, partial [Sporichthyaceae bacterium]